MVRRLCVAPLTVRRLTGHDAYGAPQHDLGVRCVAHLEPTARAVVGRDGTLHQVAGRAILPPEVAVGPDDLVEADGRTWRVLAAHPVRDPLTRLIHHVEVELA